jgi:hypothetical protein
LRTTENTDFLSGREGVAVLVVLGLLLVSVGMFSLGRYTKGKDLQPQINKIAYLERGGCTEQCFLQIETGRAVVSSILGGR